jgi:MoaA/NifB/PqqE/SkfB family radical SAM enzyme
MSQLINIAPAVNRDTIDHNRHRILRLPILLLNIHTRCNCRCVMCDIWKREGTDEFSVTKLEVHRQSFIDLGVRQVVLTGGEPLLHRSFAAVLSFLHGLNIRITLLTTGLLLEKRASEVAKGIDDIIISIDGPAHVHNHIRRVPSAFEKLTVGIHTVRTLCPLIRITARTTIQKQNHNHLCETVDAALAIGLDGVSFLPADLSTDAFNRSQAWTRERQDQIALTGHELTALEAEIEALITGHIRHIRSGFIAEDENKLRALPLRFREHLHGLPSTSPICNAPWVSAVLEVDGSVRPCFFHPSFASTRLITLQDAINTPAALAFRSNLHVPTNSVCKRCVCSLNYRESSPSALLTNEITEIRKVGEQHRAKLS